MPTLHFICYGNICRSPFAEFYARAQLEAAPLPGWTVTSSGIGAVPGSRTPKPGIRAAAALGISLEPHRARSTRHTRPDPDDLLVAMDRLVFGALAERLDVPLEHVVGPGGARLVLLMPLLDPAASGGGLDVPDPMGQGLGAYDRSYRLLQTAVDALIDQLRTHAEPSGSLPL